MRRALRSTVVMLGVVLLGSACTDEPKPGALKIVNVLTGGTSGVYYPLGLALGEIYETRAFPGVKVSVQATKASAENLNLLQVGRAEVAFTLGDSLSDAWRGEEEALFKVPLKRLRVIAGMYPNYIHIVARSDSRIRTLADLKGKRISVGSIKSGTEMNARAILRAAGLSYADFARVEYLPFGESVELMKSRQLDVTLQSAGLGVASIRELANAVKIVVVPIPDEVVQRVGDLAYQAGRIPAKTYAGQDEDVATVAIKNFLVTHEDVPRETVYRMTKSMFENLDVLVKAHSAASGIDAKTAAKNTPVPLHPGAEKYYREAGLLQ